MSDEPVTLELVGRLLNRLMLKVDSVSVDVRDLRHGQIRMERSLHELRQAPLDRAETETDIQERIDAIERRLSRLEERG